MIFRKVICRVCEGRRLEKVWDFGPSPLANSYLSKRDLDSQELVFPLEVNYCLDCGNVQSGHVVDPKVLFSNYLYASSTSKSFVKHFEDFASQFTKVGSVVDIGSNDGILLKPFQDRDWNVLGIEPARNLARIANNNGIKTVAEFFTPKLAKKIGFVDMVTATNSFAHINDIDSIVEGVKLMIDKGLFVVEVQYLLDQLENRYFDNVYHEHVQFWSVTTLEKFFKRHGLKVIHVEHIDTHGGSVRAYVARSGQIDSSVARFKSHEKMITLRRLQRFQKEIAQSKTETMTKLLKLKKQGKTIVGYGAPAKATTLCNYFGIGKDILDYIVDDSPLKQGLYTPGKHIPIVKDLGKPDYVLILAWNFAKEIKKKHPGYKYLLPL